MPLIKVLLAEDHVIVRKGIRALLDSEPNITVVGEANNGREVIELAHEHNPHIILMDNQMPEMNGLEATRQIKESLPDTQIIVLTMHSNEEYAFQFLQAGASGYLIKQSAPDELLTAIETVFEGRSYLTPEISQAVISEYIQLAQNQEVVEPDSLMTLTTREREVLQLLVEGHAPRDIADMLYISAKTVAVHRNNIMEKLNVDNFSDLVKYAIRKGLISLDN